MPTRFVFPARRQVVVEDVPSAPLQPGMVRVRTRWSLMSTGTENTAFNGMFDPASHWGAYVSYPFYPGYSAVSEVIEVADDVTKPAIGDVVFHMMAHASEQVMPAVAAFPLPAGVDLAAANWCALAGIAFLAVRRAQIVVGESTVVVGAGPVGQMAVRWARLAGSGRVIVIDPAPGRLELATTGGATDTICQPVAGALPELRSANAGGRAPVVIDATGRAATFAEALPLVADFGRLVLVGDTGNPAQQHLTSDVIARGLTMTAVHGNHMPYQMGLASMASSEGIDPERMLAERTAGWRAFSQLFFDLVRQGRFDLAGLISHTFPAERAAEAYALVNERRAETMGVLFDWADGEMPPTPG